MNFEKKLKKHIDNNLDKIVPVPYKKRKKFPLWAKILIPVGAVVTAIAVPILFNQIFNLENSIARLKGTFVDMEGVAAFGIGNLPSDGGKLQVKKLCYLNAPNSSEEDDDGDDGEGDSSSEWTEEQQELYDWESDYDWDPDKANVLFSLDESGKVKEVIYERTNNKGIVRQDTLGNAAAMYVSKNFTYVMYVNDSEWEFWQEINYAQEIVGGSGFHVHHEMMQSIVIHNETGKVFALKDLMTKVSETTGVKNYTMQARPTKDDFVNVDPMYGSFSQMTPLWFKLEYDEESGLSYENVLPEGCGYVRSHAAKSDRYGQTYVLADDEGYYQTKRLDEKLSIVQLPNCKKIEKTLITNRTNSIFFGSDNCAYAFEDNKLKVFGENFELTPIEKDKNINFEGIANEFFSGLNDTGWLNGSCFHYENGYLFSAFGQVWKIDEDGSMSELDNLEGDFVEWTNDSFMIGGQIVAFVGGEEYYHYTIDGRIVQLNFAVKDDTPIVEEKLIIESTEIWSSGHRIVALQDELGGLGRGYTKYYLLTAKDGKVQAQYIAYGDHGGMIGVVGSISEPIDFTED